MKNFKNENSGFTILELLISMAIGVVLIALLLSVYNLSIKSLRSSENRAELSQNSRVIIERLTRDIRQTRDIATVLPITGDDEQNPPPSEIEMRDGHNVEIIQYIRYYMVNTDIYRQIKQYYFESDPDTYVTFDAEDDLGNPPLVNVVEDEQIAEYVSDIGFYGTDLITVNLDLAKASSQNNTITVIYGRNL